MTTQLDPPALDAKQAAAMRVATAQLQRARVHGGSRMHRSLRALPAAPRLAAELLAIAGAMTLVVWLVYPSLMRAWQEALLWWAAHLGVPLRLDADGLSAGWVFLAEGAALVPGPLTGVVTAALVIAAFASTWWMSDRQVPLKYLVRLLCFVQATALLFFMVMPSQFPYSVAGHLDAMLASGYYLMLSLPVLLALGYGVLNIPLQRKLVDPVLLLAYFAVMLPHKALVHVLVLQHFSVLFMPLLYLCFGLVFDLMLFVALYSWLVSRAPARAAG